MSESRDWTVSKRIEVGQALKKLVGTVEWAHYEAHLHRKLADIAEEAISGDASRLTELRGRHAAIKELVADIDALILEGEQAESESKALSKALSFPGPRSPFSSGGLA